MKNKCQSERKEAKIHKAKYIVSSSFLKAHSKLWKKQREKSLKISNSNTFRSRSISQYYDVDNERRMQNNLFKNKKVFQKASG